MQNNNIPFVSKIGSANNLFLHNSIWFNISKFCDIPELINIKYICKSSNKVNITFKTIVERIRSNSFKNITTILANKLYNYFLQNKEYKYLIRVIPFTNGVVSYRIFINLDLNNTEKILGMIRRKPTILSIDTDIPRRRNRAWYSPYYVAKQTFGVNLEVFKYAIDMCVVYGLGHMLTTHEFYVDTPEDEVFMDYIENNIF